MGFVLTVEARLRQELRNYAVELRQLACTLPSGVLKASQSSAATPSSAISAASKAAVITSRSTTALQPIEGTDIKVVQKPLKHKWRK
jgi:hypothetical protein